MSLLRAASLRPCLRLLAAQHFTQRPPIPLRTFTSSRRVYLASESKLSTYRRPPHLVTTLPTNCVHCGAPLPTPLPVCPKCSFISGVSQDVAYHALFGLPYEPNPFVVDEGLLKRRFHNAQRVCHPDAWSGKDPQKQDLSAALSTYVNHAYQTLTHPYARAAYLLQQHGIEMGEADQLEDPELLMEIMEAREEIENARHPEDSEAVAQVAANNQEKIRESYRSLERLVGENNWPAVKDATIRLKYLQNIHEAARRWPARQVDDH